MVVPWEQPLTPDERKAYLNDAEKFLDHHTTSRDAVRDGQGYHQSHRAIVNPAGGLWGPQRHPGPKDPEQLTQMETELTRRLEIAREIQVKIRACPDEGVTSPHEFASDDKVQLADMRNFHFDLMHFSIFLCVDMAALEFDRKKDAGYWFDQLRFVQPLLAMFLQSQTPIIPELLTQKPGSQAQEPESQASETGSQAQEPGKKTLDTESQAAFHPKMGAKGVIQRNDAEKRDARQRDGEVCVLTQSPQVDVCHIWPFAISSTPKRARELRYVLTRHSLLLFDGSGFEGLNEILAPLSGELGASDKAWNLLTMAPTQHRDWSDVRFALKFVDGSVKAEGPGTSSERMASAIPLTPEPKTTRSGSKRKATAIPLDSPEAKMTRSPGSTAARSMPEETASAEGPSGTQGGSTSGFSTYEAELRWVSQNIPKALEKYAVGPGALCKRLLDLDSDETIESMRLSLSDAFAADAADARSRADTKGAKIRDSSGRLLESGHIVTLKSASADMHKTEAVIRSQWVMLQMASFSAAGEARDELDRDPPPPRRKGWIEVVDTAEGPEFVIHEPGPWSLGREEEGQETEKGKRS